VDRFDLLDNAPCALHSLGPDGRISHVNSTWLRWLGYSREEVEGVMSGELIFADESRPQFERLLAALVAGGRVDDIEVVMRRKDGAVFHAQLSASAEYDERGVFAFARCGFVDITARKRVEDRLRRLLDTAPDAMIVVDRTGRIEFVNLQAEAMFGYPRAEFAVMTIEMLMPERFRAGHLGHRSRYLQQPRVRPMGLDLQLVGRRKDGSEFPIEISLSPSGNDGEFVVAAVRDITERRRIEAAARLASDRLADAVESIDEAFAIFDAEGRLVMHNSAFRLLYDGVVRGAPGGRTLVELAQAITTAGGSAGGADFVAQSRACLSTPRTTGELERLGHHYHVTTRATRDGGAVMMLSDRTEERAREEELRKVSAAKSDFLSSMSHELRTPLNAILGFAQLLQRDKKTPLSGRQAGMVEHVVRGGEHLLRLIDDVLDLARIESGRVPISLEPIALTDVVQRAMTTLVPLAERVEVELVVVPEVEGLPRVLADSTRLSQILMNFGSNAIKYGRRGGHATISGEVSAPGRVRISVADDGLGIPLEKQEQVFQPFQRAGQETGPIEGTGIGLTITRRLAGLMNGDVGFESVPGTGSRFWVELPIADDAVAPKLSGERVADSPLAQDGELFTVVYIEDHPANIAFMQELLAEIARIELITAPTAEIGVDLVRSRRPSAVILDINLPGMSGFDALHLLKSWPETREIPVIALSAAAMDRDVKRGLEAGFYRYLTKPVRVDELIATLEELLVAPRK
jgi:PAS domain S-box-containing protein